MLYFKQSLVVGVCAFKNPPVDHESPSLLSDHSLYYKQSLVVGVCAFKNPPVDQESVE